jgi:hypothetical protein
VALYHGVLAPYARWRPGVVAYRGSEGDPATERNESTGRAGAGRPGADRPRYWTWAALMRRAFGWDVLRRPRCAGQMQLMATIDAPVVIQRILAHLGRPGARAGPRPPSSGAAARAEQPAPP